MLLALSTGNAVPPILGRAVAEKVLELFGARLEFDESIEGIYFKYQENKK